MPGQLHPPLPTKILSGDHAVDVSRITGIPLSYRTKAMWAPGDTPAGAVDQGIAPKDEVFLNFEQLHWGDRLRVAFALMGGYDWLSRSETWHKTCSSSLEPQPSASS